MNVFVHWFVCAGESLSGTPLTTSARISALNIVGELLRKVGVRNMLIIVDQYSHGPNCNESTALLLSADELSSCDAAGCSTQTATYF